MIKGVHAMFYSTDAAGLRKFFKEKLGFSATDIGRGWLIFDMPEADMGVHPSGHGDVDSGTADISFYCDDIKKTVAELTKKGVEFKGKIEVHSYGSVAYFKVPGNFYIQLYEANFRKDKPKTKKTVNVKSTSKTKKNVTVKKVVKKKTKK